MSGKTIRIARLSEMENGQEADLFALLSAKEELKTREGKPYFRVTFRDATREVGFPIWGDSPWADDCRRQWATGVSYKMRAIFRETSYGPQLEIRKIRPAVEADRADGYEPDRLVPCSRFDPQVMFAELREFAATRVAKPELRDLVVGLLDENRQALLALPAATRNHHAFAGGWLEHVLSVAKTALFLTEKYAAHYPDMRTPLDDDLVVAGAILHDIGKIRELACGPEGYEYSASGHLIGHILQGRDMVREVAAKLAQAGRPLDPETLLRLEHVIVSHQRLPEWGSPKPPMTPEALLVHYADDLDAKFNMLYVALRDDTTTGHVTSKKNVLTQPFFKGLRSE